MNYHTATNLLEAMDLSENDSSLGSGNSSKTNDSSNIDENSFLDHFYVLLEDDELHCKAPPGGYYISDKSFNLWLFYFLSDLKETSANGVSHSVNACCRFAGCEAVLSYPGKTTASMHAHLRKHYDDLVESKLASHKFSLDPNCDLTRVIEASSETYGIPRSYFNSKLFALMSQTIVDSFVALLESEGELTEEILQVSKQFRFGNNPDDSSS